MDTREICKYKLEKTEMIVVGVRDIFGRERPLVPPVPVKIMDRNVVVLL